MSEWVSEWSRSVVSNSLWPPWTVAYQAPLSMGFSRQESAYTFHQIPNVAGLSKKLQSHKKARDRSQVRQHRVSWMADAAQRNPAEENGFEFFKIAVKSNVSLPSFLSETYLFLLIFSCAVQTWIISSFFRWIICSIRTSLFRTNTRWFSLINFAILWFRTLQACGCIE